MDACCATHPLARPSFTEVAEALEQLHGSYEQHAPAFALPPSRNSCPL
jgi:hypothetical protein